MQQEARIRPATLADAPELADLCVQLGYPATPADLRARLPMLLSSDEHLVAVAVGTDDRALGWIHAVLRLVLESEAFVQVAGLVVDERARSSGIGRELLGHAEAWARERGVAQVRVRSNVVRERAHAFYLREGYALAKTSCLFVKTLVARA